MKLFLLFLMFVICKASISQKTEKFYDFFWRPSSAQEATFFSVVEKTDSGWFRNDYYARTQKLQMQALYADADCKIANGHYYYFHPNENISFMGKKIQGKNEGICVRYYSNGMLSDSALYAGGKVVDKRLKWFSNGYMSDSMNKVNDSTYVIVGWFDNGQLAYAGYLVNDEKHGKWKYFHNNGAVSATGVFANGKRISMEYFDETGKTLTDTSLVNREAMFTGGQAAWRKYLERNLSWPKGLKLTADGSVTVGISFVVDENGKILNAEVYMPFYKDFDEMALAIIKNSPPWLPAIHYNRKVKAYLRQPVTFVYSEE